MVFVTLLVTKGGNIRTPSAYALTGDLETGLHIINRDGVVTGGYYMIEGETLYRYEENGIKDEDYVQFKKTRVFSDDDLEYLRKTEFFLLYPTPSILHMTE